MTFFFLHSTLNAKIPRSSEYTHMMNLKQILDWALCCLPTCRFTEDSLTFKATGLPEKRKYENTVNFLKKINTENVVSKNSGRCYEFIITKSNTKEDYWKSLTNDSKKPHWLKVSVDSLTGLMACVISRPIQSTSWTLSLHPLCRLCMSQTWLT